MNAYESLRAVSCGRYGHTLSERDAREILMRLDAAEEACKLMSLIEPPGDSPHFTTLCSALADWRQKAEPKPAHRVTYTNFTENGTLVECACGQGFAGPGPFAVEAFTEHVVALKGKS